MSQATLHCAWIIGGVIFSGYTAPCMFVVTHEDCFMSGVSNVRPARS